MYRIEKDSPLIIPHIPPEEGVSTQVSLKIMFEKTFV
jgi:hypothetical protein